ncbi:unnamed protein product [Cunninghamella blakesleeana]
MNKICHFIALLAIIQQVLCQATTCPAEANFQGCKQIEQDKLSKCSPVDYTCQCTAQKLIQQCYNLCPNYQSDATIHDSVVQSICSAVPAVSSSSLLPASSVPLPSASISPSASSTPNQQHSNANRNTISYMTFFFITFSFYFL